MRAPSSRSMRVLVLVVLPGVGQFYAGHFVWGIVWLIITPGLWIGSGGFLGWICHIVSAYTAYQYALRESAVELLEE